MYPRSTAFLITCGQRLLRLFSPLFFWMAVLLPLPPRSLGAPRFDQTCSFPSMVCSITTGTNLLINPGTLETQFDSMSSVPSPVCGDFSRVGDIEIRLATPMRHTTPMRQHCMRQDYKRPRCSIYDYWQKCFPYLCLSRYYLYIVFLPFLSPCPWSPLHVLTQQ